MTASPTTDGPGGGTFGLVVVGGAEVAVPIDSLREVLPCPAELAALPVRSDRLLGAIELRSQALPIVDVLQPRDVELGGSLIVVVLARGGRTIGLLADGIRGLVQVDADAMHEVTAAGAQLLASHTFLHPDDRRVVSVLDVDAVLSLEGVPVVHADAAVTIKGAAAASDRRVMTVLRCGGHHIAVDVADVHTIVPDPAAIGSVLTGGCCVGATVFGEEKVALVDLLTVLGLGAMPKGTPAAGLVVRFDDGLLVLALTATLDIVTAAPDEVLPVPVHAVGRPDVVRGLLALPDASALVLDMAALRADPDLRTLAALRTPVDASRWVEHEQDGRSGTATGGAMAGDGRSTACLSYSIGFDIATPLEQIDEIIPMPDQITEVERDGRTIGVALHRRSAIPLLLLAEMLGREVSITATQCVLVVDVDGERWGVVVDRLNEIANRTWEADPEDRASSGGLTGSRLVTLGGSKHMVPEVDLRAVIRAATGRAPSVDPDRELEPVG